VLIVCILQCLSPSGLLWSCAVPIGLLHIVTGMLQQLCSRFALVMSHLVYCNGCVKLQVISSGLEVFVCGFHSCYLFFLALCCGSMW